MNHTLSILLLSFLIVSCQSTADNAKTIEPVPNSESSTIEPVLSEEEKEVKVVFDKILMAVGNRDIQALSDLSFQKATIGYTFMKDSVWINREITIKEFFSSISGIKSPKPFSETALEYDITITDGRLATITVPTIISEFGIALSNEVNHVTMMKENDQWKLLSVAWTVHKIPDEEKEFDLNLFALGYAQVWNSDRPEFVAMFFEEEGILHKSDETPILGRKAISTYAQSLMTKFPVLNIHMDSLVIIPSGIEFHWTFTGMDLTNNNQKITMSGFELWTMSDDNLIKEAKSAFPLEN